MCDKRMTYLEEWMITVISFFVVFCASGEIISAVYIWCQASGRWWFSLLGIICGQCVGEDTKNDLLPQEAVVGGFPLSADESQVLGRTSIWDNRRLTNPLTKLQIVPMMKHVAMSSKSERNIPEKVYGEGYSSLLCRCWYVHCTACWHFPIHRRTKAWCAGWRLGVLPPLHV